MCTLMLKHAVAHGTSAQTWSPLLHLGIKPASAVCRSDAQPIVLHPHQGKFKRGQLLMYCNLCHTC